MLKRESNPKDVLKDQDLNTLNFKNLGKSDGPALEETNIRQEKTNPDAFTDSKLQGYLKEYGPTTLDDIQKIRSVIEYVS